MLTSIRKKVKRIPIWIWGITVILIILFSLSSYEYIMQNSRSISLLSLIFSQVNDVDIVSIPMIIMFLPLYGTVLDNKNALFKSNLYQSKKLRHLMFIIVYNTILVIIFFLLIYFINVLVFYIKGGTEIDVNNFWFDTLGIGAEISIPLSFLLICFRFIFLSLLAFFFDSFNKIRPLGFISAILIGWIDGFLIYIVSDFPIGILPIENSRIQFTPTWGDNEVLTRVPYVNSIIYWIFLITLITVLLYFRVGKKSSALIIENDLGVDL